MWYEKRLFCRPYTVYSIDSFWLPLVVCLPMRLRFIYTTSNVAIHHIVLLSPSNCCNPSSSSSPITLFLVLLLSFPFHSSLDYDSEDRLFHHHVCGPTIFPLGFVLFLPGISVCSISSFAMRSIQLTLSILHDVAHIHNSTY